MSERVGEHHADIIEQPPDAKTKIGNSIRDFGIGHIKNVDFSVEEIPLKIVEAHEDSLLIVEKLLGDISALLNTIEVEVEKKEIFIDVVNGISCALHRTLNQITYHSKINFNESKNALNELSMLLEIVHQSFDHPKIKDKKAYPKAGASVYHLVPPSEESFSRQVTATDTLFSKEHIAWNVESNSPYDKKPKIKSGIRLDYNPLYKEEDGVIDKTKTQWVTSVDISGFHIDKIMNQYSLRGHHFTDVFKYKVGLLIPGFAKALGQYFDENGEMVTP